jgi:citrate lyase alpha subunit
MSLKTFLQKTLDRIKSLFTNIPSETATALKISIMITENIKNFIDSPVADVLTVTIPGDIDDIIRNKLQPSIPALLTELKPVESSLNLTQPNAIANTAIETIKTMDKNIKSSVSHQLSILITQEVVVGKLSWSDGVYLSQWYCENKFKTANTTQ